MSFKEIKCGEVVQIGNIAVKSVSLNHPGGSLGYKIICNNKSVAYIGDHEQTETSRKTLVDFLMNADQVIFDAQYTPEEYSGSDGYGGRNGWGHSTWMHGVELCREANVEQLILTHHGREDIEAERIELMAQKKFPNTIAAYEGLEIDLD